MDIKVLISIALAFLLIPVASASVSHRDTTLPIPDNTSVALPPVKYTPDSPFYGLERFIENVRLWVTFDEKAKLKLQMHYAEMRLAEAQLMAKENKTEYVSKLINDYMNEFNKTAGKIQEKYEMCMIREQAKCEAMPLDKVCSSLNINVSNCTNKTASCEIYSETRCGEWASLVENAYNNTQKHIIVLEKVLDKVPTQAKSAIQHAIEVSKTNGVVMKKQVLRIVRNEFEHRKHEFEHIVNGTIENGEEIGNNMNNEMNNMTTGINHIKSNNTTGNGSAHLPPHEQPWYRID
jgi:hypothetical protein